MCTCLCMNVFMPPAGAGYDSTSIFKRNLASFDFGFSFSRAGCHTKSKEPNLSYDLPITAWRIIEFTHFPNVLALYEMQTTLPKIRTRVALSTSND